jgi:segregation and condensation protein A
VTDDDILAFEGPDANSGADVEPRQLVLQIDGFEGPLDVLLVLARTQKVDLSKISILELVEQYLVFVAEAKKLRLELAADYLVMAAWLAFLKSRLLLPKEADDEEPSAEELAMRLQLRLQRLDAMREAGARLMSSNRLGREVMARGNPEQVVVIRNAAYDVTLYELLKTYAEQRVRTSVTSLKIPLRPVYSLDEALHRMADLLGAKMDWRTLYDFLPDNIKDPQYRRSAIASMFAASLELVKEGKAELQQDKPYSTLYLKPKTGQDN